MTPGPWPAQPRGHGCSRGAFLPVLFCGQKVAYALFSFFLMQRLRKSGKQNILIIIQASGLHKRFHSPLHQTLTVQTTNSVFAAIKHFGGGEGRKKKKSIFHLLETYKILCGEK